MIYVIIISIIIVGIFWYKNVQLRHQAENKMYSFNQELTTTIQQQEQELSILQRQITNDEQKLNTIKQQLKETEWYYNNRCAQVENDIKKQSELYTEQYKYKTERAVKELEDKKDQRIEIINSEIKAVEQELAEYQLKRESINEAIRRQREIDEQQEFYKIQLTDKDQSDISTLREIEPRFFNKNVIGKIIWDVYLSRPLNELIKRVLGTQQKSGIYKITYIKTGEAYIGKSKNIQERWKQHLKTVVGLDGAAQSTIHKAMEEKGLWNFTFELLEEIPPENLSEREKFYINLYGTKQQFNQKDGG